MPPVRTERTRYHRRTVRVPRGRHFEMMDVPLIVVEVQDVGGDVIMLGLEHQDRLREIVFLLMNLLDMPVCHLVLPVRVGVQ
ncbi:hypothetical protein K435DRAFT_964291 [Dendrothele bispora CBS 962.96]|uniref:Uncharacterized protein n=1 Tax=Dendrothele bispora (strain CBS 962.96) TaxID=1314807 RepID=A0A4S8MBF3_DENBC|nr:hypothetical protein K435DRAFT_964291 [Dendrothele bispora CBS 962.96]